MESAAASLSEISDRRVFKPPFDPADIGAINIGIDGKLLLGNAFATRIRRKFQATSPMPSMPERHHLTVH